MSTASARDQHIAELVQKFKFAVVDKSEVPATVAADNDDNEHTLLEETGRPIVKQTDYFSFRIADKGYTAPATTVQRLRRVRVDHANNTNNLVVRGVHIIDDCLDITDRRELNTEMYHWGHQVYMVSYNDDAHPEYNVVIHVPRYGEDGHWEVRDYIAGVSIDKNHVFIKGLRNEPGEPT